MAVGDKSKNPTAQQSQYIFNLVYDADAQALRIVGIDGAGKLLDPVVITKIDETTTADMVYIGCAAPGSLDSSAVWKIQRIDESSDPIEILRADGDSEFNNVWNNRASLSYS